VRLSTLLWGLCGSTVALFAAGPALAGDPQPPAGMQRYPTAYVDRPLTLPGFTLSPDVSFDATQAVKDPNSATKTLETNLAFSTGAAFGITHDLEVRASLGTLRVSPKFQYSEPRLGATFRFVGSEKFQMGVHAEATALLDPGAGGARFELSLPMLGRLGSSVRIDLAPGAPVTIQENKATTFGVNLPVALAFQVVDAVHLGARTSMTITDFNDPLANMVIPLGFFGGVSLGSEKPIVEIDPYFTWTDFARPGATGSNDKVSIDKFSAGLTARLYLYL